MTFYTIDASGIIIYKKALESNRIFDKNQKYRNSNKIY